MRQFGFTLLEVLLALLVFTVGVLALLSTLGPIVRLAGEGRERGRIAQALESRIDWLRAEAGRKGGCEALAPGSFRRPDGVRESWKVTVRPGSLELIAWARGEARGKAPDTVISRIPCR